MKISINQQGELVKLQPLCKRVIFPHILGRGDRRITTHFSKRSRKNLLEKFAIIDQDKAKNATFITLTYVENFQDHKRAYSHVNAFLKRISRKHEDCFAVWKKELQERGAIHFHLMVWNLPYLDKEWVAWTWGEITNNFETLQCSDGDSQEVPPFTRIEYCKARRKCWYYLSKYLGKTKKVQEENNKLTELAKQASDAITTGQEVYRLPVGLTTAQIQPMVVSEADIFADSPIEQSSGRWWGWFNRKNIPLAMEVQTVIEMDWRDYKRFRRELEFFAGYTAQIHVSHTVKMFWFWQSLQPITMVMAIINGEMVYTAARKRTNGEWENT